MTFAGGPFGGESGANGERSVTETSLGDAGRSDGRPAVQPATIDVDGVSLSFGDLSVLEEVSLTVEPGEFVGFVGPNGAGKTTLLRLVSGALEPDAGRVTIDGVDVHDADSATSSRLVSVVPQDTTLSFSFPVRDVVEMGRHPHRSRFSGPTPADRRAVESAIERTRTADLADRPIDEVSGGQRQRVVLARAIAQETPAMLLDEPTASLDINHQLETLELVRELVDEGRTVCAAIHDLDLAARYCDRLVMLADGAVYRSGPPADVLTGDALGDVFDAAATVTPNPITGTETVTALPPDRPDDAGDGSPSGDRTDRSRVHVFGTGGTAAGVLGRLEAAHTDLEVSVGPVTEGDTAAETARALGVDRLEHQPFESLTAAALESFETRVRTADVTVVTANLVGSTGSGTRRLLETVDAGTDSVVIVTRDEAEPSRVATRTATPATVLEAVRDVLERGSDSEYAVAAVSDPGSTSSDGDSGAAEAESSSD